jgi:hypothetical protein
MRKKIILGLILIVMGLVALRCGKEQFGGESSAPYTPVQVDSLFDVSGAKAIVSASTATVTGSNVRALATSANEILKLTSTGELTSIISLPASQRPPISVIEVGPDGSLYVGFQWGIWIPSSTRESSRGEQAAFFKIKPSGAAEVIDRNIYGVGSWYSYSENCELPVKQVKFDGEGNVYYLGTGTSGQTTVLKRKTPAGVISQIGNNQMSVRDFYVCPNGFVLFHGSNAGNWNIEWLRLIYKGSTKALFYNTGATGWLRSYYYIPQTKSVMLVGQNLEIKDQLGNSNAIRALFKLNWMLTAKPLRSKIYTMTIISWRAIPGAVSASRLFMATGIRKRSVAGAFLKNKAPTVPFCPFLSKPEFPRKASSVSLRESSILSPASPPCQPLLAPILPVRKQLMEKPLIILPIKSMPSLASTLREPPGNNGKLITACRE